MRIQTFLISIFFTLALQAQGTFIPLNHDSYHLIDRLEIKYGKILPYAHTSVKPYSKRMAGMLSQRLHKSNIELSNFDRWSTRYLIKENSEWVDSISITTKKPPLNFFYKEPASFVSVETEDFILKANPVINVEFSTQLGADSLQLRNTRGAEVRAYIAKKVGIYFYVGENQIKPPYWVRKKYTLNPNDPSTQYLAVPGEGFYKSYRGFGADYFTARGYVTFNFLKHFDLQFGHDKNFIGNGYRSLFLSDNSNNMFFLKLNTKIWKINYQNIFAELTSQYVRAGDRLLTKKYGVFHHLNYQVTPWLSFGVFEGIILVRDNQFELHYLNPIIFYRSIEQDLGSPDNAVVGLDMKMNLFNSISIYGQLLFDEWNFSQLTQNTGWWANKYGFQGGLKYIDIGGVSGLDGQVEMNLVKPYTYTHNAVPGDDISNYTHYNQAIAHPLGANFLEFIVRANYRPINEVEVELKYFNITQGVDTNGSHWGSNILRRSQVGTIEREFGNTLLQGVRENIHLVHLRGSYQPWHNIYIDLVFSGRYRKSPVLGNTTYVTAGLGVRMNLPYRTYDF